MALAFSILEGKSAFAELGTGLQTSVALDLLAETGESSAIGFADGIRVREAELVFTSPSDYLFDAQFSLASHFENGLSALDLHEAYVSTSKLIPRSRLRAGQFFLGFGRLNQFHRHDWPFVSAPAYHRAFFDSHGVLDSGVEYTWLVPTPFFLELTAGITNGYSFKHSHDAGQKPQIPTHYLRTTLFQDLPWNGGLQMGLNYVGRKDNSGTQISLFGIDTTAKWRQGRILRWLWQAEGWFRLTESRASDRREIGFFVHNEYGPSQTLSTGLRLGYYSTLGLLDGAMNPYPAFQWELMPSLTWKPSEFTTFRLAFHYEPRTEGSTVTSSYYVELQTVVLLGSHPAHDF